MEEYLPVIEKKFHRLLVKGKIERRNAHGTSPVYHATAIIIAVLPDGKILLSDKTEKQRAKGQNIPLQNHIYDTFGGHMTYERIPEKELETGISLDTFKKCACRELYEELLVEEDGKRYGIRVRDENLETVGFYEMVNDHNKEYSWVFLHRLMYKKKYVSEDTLETQNGWKKIQQPVRAFSYKEIQDIFQNNTDGNFLSDGLGRVLRKDDRLKNYINNQ